MANRILHDLLQRRKRPCDVQREDVNARAVRLRVREEFVESTDIARSGDDAVAAREDALGEREAEPGGGAWYRIVPRLTQCFGSQGRVGEMRRAYR